jgi:phage tail-like protein
VTNFIETTVGAYTGQVENLLGSSGPTAYSPVGLAMRFRVAIDGLDLGGWSSCKGLRAEFKPQRFREQGNPMFEKIQFGEISYPPVVLERAMRQDDSAALQKWLTAQLRSWLIDPTSYQPKNASITLLDNAGAVVTTWNLRRVYPASWTGPTLNGGQSAVAAESLELIHEGFL